MPDSTTIAHISDLHLTLPSGLSPRNLNLKRTLGLVNWHRSRKRVHKADVIAMLVADMVAARPDHIAVTGDLCNIGLPREYSAALAWLEGLGAPADVTVVPGNHDIYSRIGNHPGVDLWRAFMCSDDFGSAIAGAGTALRGFPIVRHVGCVALIGVNSAIETRPFVAAGRIGVGQLEALAAVLENLATKRLARVVLIHHPPLTNQAPPRRGLADAKELEAILRTAGAELVLHGHNHRDTLAWCEGPSGTIPIVGIASGSAGRRHRDEPLARYNLVRVRPTSSNWSIEVTGRGLPLQGSGIIELDRHVLNAAMT